MMGLMSKSKRGGPKGQRTQSTHLAQALYRAEHRHRQLILLLLLLLLLWGGHGVRAVTSAGVAYGVEGHGVNSGVMNGNMCARAAASPAVTVALRGQGFGFGCVDEVASVDVFSQEVLIIEARESGSGGGGTKLSRRNGG
ncbi:hypothetical protein LXA43DRAFT_1029382 [Ganoderma leucocontextum]|nr:hypothetical protein LXA43DRAFT_1029382 [Ganoderma leucocontextum]